MFFIPYLGPIWTVKEAKFVPRYYVLCCHSVVAMSKSSLFLRARSGPVSTVKQSSALTTMDVLLVSVRHSFFQLVHYTRLVFPSRPV